MSVIQAEVEVDETNIPQVSLGQTAKVVIDALPERTFQGKVTEIGNSPIQAPGGGASRQATNFKVVIAIEGDIPEVRPSFTCTADITTAKRAGSTAVPIAAVAVRELIYDEAGQIVREQRTGRRRRPRSEGSMMDPVASAAELPAGQTRKETEGVFVMRNGRAEFVPIKMGIAGEQYFEVLSGLKAGDQVITGPFASVRTMSDGDAVRIEATRVRDGR
jgi:HlyD family secretion protein